MLNTEKSVALIAKWRTGADPSVDRPYAVYWADGSPARYEDYLNHATDTHHWHDGSGGMEFHMFPDINGEVRYDHSAGRWYLSGRGIVPTALSLTDLNSPDEQILAELYTFPIVYRARIYR